MAKRRIVALCIVVVIIEFCGCGGDGDGGDGGGGPNGTYGGDITIEYTLKNPASNPCDITVYYSEDGGVIFTPATGGAGGDGTTGLASSALGTDHTFVWDSIADLGNCDLQDDIQIQIIPYDTVAEEDGEPIFTENFRVNNIPRTIIATINLPADSEPFGIAVSLDSAWVYVANYSNKLGTTVTVINASDNTIEKTLDVSLAPMNFGVSPDGAYIYVVCSYDDRVDVIQTSDNTVVGSINIWDGGAGGNTPIGIAVGFPGTPSVDRLYLASRWSQTVEVVDVSDPDPANFDVIFSVDLESVFDGFPDFFGAEGCAITPDGNFIFVTDKSGNHIAKIQTSDNTIVDVLDLGAEMWDIMVAPDGNLLYATDLGGAMHIIDVATNLPSDPPTIDALPRSLPLDILSDGSLIFVGDSGTGGNPVMNVGPLVPDSGAMRIISTVTNAELYTVPVGNPRGIAIAPNGKRVYVTDVIDDTVEVIGFSNP